MDHRRTFKLQSFKRSFALKVQLVALGLCCYASFVLLTSLFPENKFCCSRGTGTTTFAVEVAQENKLSRRVNHNEMFMTAYIATSDITDTVLPTDWCIRTVINSNCPPLDSTRHPATFQYLKRIKSQTLRYKIRSILNTIRSGADWIFVTPSRANNETLILFNELISSNSSTAITFSNTGIVDPCVLQTNRRDDWRTHQFLLQRTTGRLVYNVIQDVTQTNNRSLGGVGRCSPPAVLSPGSFVAGVWPSLLLHSSHLWFSAAAVAHGADVDEAAVSVCLQRLMWETNQRLSVLSVSSSLLGKHVRNREDCTGVRYERPHNMSELVTKATEWICTSNRSSFEQCAHELISFLFQGNSLENEKDLLINWFIELSHMGYSFPRRVPMAATKLPSNSHGLPLVLSPSPAHPINHVQNRTLFDLYLSFNKIDYYSDKYFLDGKANLTKENVLRTSLQKSDKNASTKTGNTTVLTSLCKVANITIRPRIPGKFTFPDILLVVVFNYPFLSTSIPILLSLYGRHFKQILFCGENFSNLQHFYNMTSHPHVSYVEVTHYRGVYGYGCTSAAIKMNYDVRGYLQLGDDVLLNTWNLKELPRDKMWFQSRMRIADVRKRRVPDIATTNRWYPWIFNSGQPAAIRSFIELRDQARNGVSSSKVKRFLAQLNSTTNCETCVAYEASDIFYVPRHLALDFAYFADLFFRNGLHLEVAVPTALFGLAAEWDVIRLRGNYIWGFDRALFVQYYSDRDHFQHAFKLSRLTTKDGLQFMCRVYLPRLEKDITNG